MIAAHDVGIEDAILHARLRPRRADPPGWMAPPQPVASPLLASGGLLLLRSTLSSKIMTLGLLITCDAGSLRVQAVGAVRGPVFVTMVRPTVHMIPPL